MDAPPLPKPFKEFLRDRTIEKTQALVRWLYPNVKAAQKITPTQAYIVKRIAFSEVKRLSISAYTRYGKSQTVAIAVSIYILINFNKKVKFIGPTDDQAGLIKDYMSELILGSQDDMLLNIAEIQAAGPARLKAEASQKRMTFKNGCEYRVVTAHGKGFAAMGHGADLIIMDEAAMISRESYAKITRMLGDDPENAMLIELFNPWDRDTKAFDHSISERFERIQVDWRVGIQEGRTTEAFIEEMRGDITPLEFVVLYESRFPDEAEDSLHSLSTINAAENRIFNLKDELMSLIDKLDKKHQMQESEYKDLIEQIQRYKLILSCDPADKGLDFSVMMWGICKDNQYYEPIDLYSEGKSDSMALVGKIMQKVEEYMPREAKSFIHIDKIGIGVGPESRLREIKNEKDWHNLRVVGCHYGERAIQKDEFLNKKAENNFRLKSLLTDGYVAFGIIKQHPEYDKLKAELLNMKWEITSSQKKKVIDPDEKSPDYNDALVYFVWKDSKALTYDFL